MADNKGPSEGVRRHLMATGEYNKSGSSWASKSSGGGKSTAAVVGKGVIKGAAFILRGGKKKS